VRRLGPHFAEAEDVTERLDTGHAPNPRGRYFCASPLGYCFGVNQNGEPEMKCLPEGFDGLRISAIAGCLSLYRLPAAEAEISCPAADRIGSRRHPFWR
jgi:hypothetical protein